VVHGRARRARPPPCRHDPGLRADRAADQARRKCRAGHRHPRHAGPRRRPPLARLKGQPTHPFQFRGHP
jgi:hypothetical protein